MRFGELIPGIFMERLNRFVAHCEVEGRLCRVHVPNTGRLRELLVRGACVLLRRPKQPGLTEYGLLLVRYRGLWVSVDSASLPNRVVREALEQGNLPGFSGYDRVRPEAAYGKGRLDFMLYRGEELFACLEVKGVTLVEEGAALFPDAPTIRGRRHVEELASLAGSGTRAAVLFVVQREDARFFAPNWRTDRKFCEALCRAVHAGVEVWAYGCAVDPTGAALQRELPVGLLFKRRQP